MSSLSIPGSSAGVTATALSFTVSWRVAAMKSSSVFAASGVLCRLGSPFWMGFKEMSQKHMAGREKKEKNGDFSS